MSELNISVVIMQENMLISGEIYCAGKNFTLPPAVTALANITSGPKLLNPHNWAENTLCDEIRISAVQEKVNQMKMKMWITKMLVCKGFLELNDTILGRCAKNQNGNLRWHLPLGVRPPPPLMAKFPDIFLPHFFSFAIESYIYETDFTLQKYHF